MRGIDYFAGAGGWDVAAAHWLGWEVTGHEIMLDARLTRSAFGLKTSEINDVREVEAVPGEAEVHIASAPCQPFSPAGLGTGRRALDAVLAVVKSHHDRRPMTYAQAAALTGDERTALVVEPLRLALQGRPVFIAWEQVPAVLPVWQACADVLRSNGYSAAVGYVNAEQYGVPQTRKRAILVARRDGAPATLPTPTHSRYYSRTPERIDEGVLPWVSMAEALGWGMTARPYPTIACSSGTGGPDKEKVGGSAARRIIYTERAAGRWTLGEAHRWRWLYRPDGEPQHGDDGESVRITLAEAAALQTFPPDFPFAGTRTTQFMQIGNAVPPLLAYAILSTFVTRPAAPERIEPEQLSLFSGWAMAA